MYCTDAFPHILEKKIDKTSEARHGKGIYKRRNSRSYRVIMHLPTYKNIIDRDRSFLENFKRGFAVRVKPNEYFNTSGEVSNSFPSDLVLGVNAFVYFKTIKDWNKYKSYCKKDSGETWEEVIELYTKSKTIPNDDQWVGQYCKFINNTIPKEISPICGSNNSQEYLDSIKTKYKLTKVPKQAGLGNFGYDYANEEEMEKIEYQLSYMILKVAGIKKYLINILNSTENSELNVNIRSAKESKELPKYIDNVSNHIEEYCKDKDLLNFKLLSKNRAWNIELNEPICPLCQKVLKPEKFFEVASQDEGREEEDNTQAEIVLMHIKGLKPGELNHKTYNLGWGHKHCNTIQGSYDIEEILEFMKEIAGNK